MFFMYHHSPQMFALALVILAFMLTYYASKAIWAGIKAAFWWAMDRCNVFPPLK